jgi:hypothetical protein
MGESRLLEKCATQVRNQAGINGKNKECHQGGGPRKDGTGWLTTKNGDSARSRVHMLLRTTNTTILEAAYGPK